MDTLLPVPIKKNPSGAKSVRPVVRSAESARLPMARRAGAVADGTNGLEV